MELVGEGSAEGGRGAVRAACSITCRKAEGTASRLVSPREDMVGCDVRLSARGMMRVKVWARDCGW